jgi:adenylosuccinate lyase
MPESFTFETYLSPFTHRYGSAEMRALWSEAHKRRLWRQVWVALAEAQHEAGLVASDQLDDLKAHAGQVVIERSLEIEKEIHHDLMAELRAFAEQCPAGGPVLHLGATSTDIEDNADALRLREGLALIQARLRACLSALADPIEQWADTPAVGFTHLQPAEPTTVGYRLAQTGQDLLTDWHEIERARESIRGKGFKGAVGTGAAYAALLAGRGVSAADLEARALAGLGLAAFPVTSQTYPRKQDWLVLNALAGLGGTLYKFAFDLRLLQSPLAGEWAEPFASRQVGSSAMPFKRNPIQAEKMDSLARLLAGLPRAAWDNAAHSLLERTLDDSANRRSILPEAFLAADELLTTATRLIAGLQVNAGAAERNLRAHGLLAGLEPLLMALARAGADRQAMHERLRRHAGRAWEAARAGALNPLADDLASDPEVLQYLDEQQIRAALDIAGYLGDAPQRAVDMAGRIRRILA